MKSLINCLAISLSFVLLTGTISHAAGRDICPPCCGNTTKAAPSEYLKNWLDTEQASLEEFFGVEASFSTFDDGHEPNAYADWSEPGTGEVVFGESLLLHFLMKGESGKWAILSVMAHEYGHILQMERDVRLYGRPLELHADFLAGYYLGKVLPDSMRTHVRSVMAGCFFDFGDYWLNSPGHHGTPQERMLVALEGFSRSNMCLEEAFAYGAAFAKYR